MGCVDGKRTVYGWWDEVRSGVGVITSSKSGRGINAAHGGS